MQEVAGCLAQVDDLEYRYQCEDLMKKIKYLFTGIGLLTAVLVALWFNTEVLPAPTHEASVALAGSNAKLILRLQPMHPHLAEYRRFLVLQMPNGHERTIELQPDSGGFARTQLYQLSDGRIVIQGYLDAAIASPSTSGLSLTPAVPSGGTYIGAFDKNKDGEWKFIEPKDGSEQQLNASGG
jgi:hypothetical protein